MYGAMQRVGWRLELHCLLALVMGEFKVVQCDWFEFCKVHYYYLFVSGVTVLQALRADSVVVPSSNCYALDNSSRIVDFVSLQLPRILNFMTCIYICMYVYI